MEKLHILLGIGIIIAWIGILASPSTMINSFNEGNPELWEKISNKLIRIGGISLVILLILMGILQIIGYYWG